MAGCQSIRRNNGLYQLSELFILGPSFIIIIYDVLDVLLHLGSEPTALKVQGRFGSSEQNCLDVIQDAGDARLRRLGVFVQFAIHYRQDPKPGEPAPTLGEVITLVMTKPIEQSLAAGTSLPNVYDTEIVIIEDVDALLIAEVHLRGALLPSVLPAQASASTSAWRSPGHAVALPEQSIVLNEHVPPQLIETVQNGSMIKGRSEVNCLL